MNNKPTLFVNSVEYVTNCSGNQIFYDSRKYVKSKIFHRFDDIISFLLMGRRVFVKIMVNALELEGYIIHIDHKIIQIKSYESIRIINIADISGIKIINVF